MDHPTVAAIGALGAWLLVAGPLHQASMELREQGLAQRRRLPESGVDPHPVSGWWWLLPPVAYWKHHRERERLRRAALAVLPAADVDVERMISFSTTARGWLVVAAGATLIGVKETWELVEVNDWPAPTTWVIVAVALLLSVGNAAVTAVRTGQILSLIGNERR